MSLLSSIASLFNNEKPVTAAMAYYDPSTGEELANTGGFKAFQYFPEKVSDSKSVDYSQKSVPGASHPIYTFISGGERTITFDAIFVDDAGPTSASDLLSGGKTFSVKDADKRDIQDIESAIKWLRYCMYPSYKSGVAKAPPLVVLYLPNSGIIGTGNYTDSIVGILRRADVTYEAFYRNGKPRIAVVSIEIVEVIQTKRGWGFQGTESSQFDKSYIPNRTSSSPSKSLI